MAQNKRFYTSRNESNLTAEKIFSFHTSQAQTTVKNLELLKDSGCTSLIKDAELFSNLYVSKIGRVQCANGSESSTEGGRSVRFLVKDN